MNDFRQGYETAKRLWEETGKPTIFDPPNPFQIGTAAEEGFEAAVYELPQNLETS